MFFLLQVMERALSIVNSLHLVSTVCVFDQAIYSKTGKIKWKDPMKFKPCIVMMRVFHILMTYMSILNKCISDAGLKDALIQSSIVAEGSIDSALRGKCYNRGLRLYKVFYESLLRLIMPHVYDTQENSSVIELKDSITTCDKFSKEHYMDIKDNEMFQQLLNNFIDLKISWSTQGDLQQFWVSYIEMIDILLNTTYAVRSGT